VNGYRPRDEDVYVTYSVPGKQVALFAMRDDRTMFLFVFSDNEGRRIDSQDTNAHKDALRAEFEQAGWECPQILAAMESCNEVYFDRVSQIQMDKWSQGRVGTLEMPLFAPRFLLARALHWRWLQPMSWRVSWAGRQACRRRHLSVMKSGCIHSLLVNKRPRYNLLVPSRRRHD
jgi:hypothetical protein